MNVTEHLLSRSVNLELYKNTLTVSEENQSATFYLWNTSGQLVGFQQYRPNQPKVDYTLDPRMLRYFTFVSKESESSQKLTAFGLELLNPENRTLFVVEGVFDAVKLHNLGLNCLALLSATPKPLREWLWTLGYNVVPVCEDDKAGKLLKKMSNNGDYLELTNGQDLGDMKDSEVFELFKEYL